MKKTKEEILKDAMTEYNSTMWEEYQIDDERLTDILLEAMDAFASQERSKAKKDGIIEMAISVINKGGVKCEKHYNDVWWHVDYQSVEDIKNELISKL